MTGKKPKPLRVFCAVELPGELRERVAERMRQLRAEFPDARAFWEKPEKLHVTLKFLGDVEHARVEALSGAAARAVSNIEPFELGIDTPGSFPSRGQPRVLWLRIADASGRLAFMQRALEAECAADGFPRDPRAFLPHLTLARVRSPRGTRELAAAHRKTPFEPQRFKVSELVVMRSDLGPGGSRHTPLSRHLLGGLS